MKLLFIFLSLAISLIWCTPVRAEIEIGLIGQSGWSDNFYLGNPDGWGIYASKSLSRKLAFRLSFNRIDNSFRYIGKMQFGLIPPNADTTREFILSETTVDFIEISLYHTLVQGCKMRLDVGGGIGVADFDLHLYGESTGKKISIEQSTNVLTLTVNVMVKKIFRSPLALRLGYQYRTMSTFSQSTDSLEPFNDVTFSSIYTAVFMRW